jgi:hypothetical protein
VLVQRFELAAAVARRELRRHLVALHEGTLYITVVCKGGCRQQQSQ